MVSERGVDLLSSNMSGEDQPIAFAPRLVASDGFLQLYGDGMALIEQVAEYLDGDGKEESRDLPREAALLYASESMKLTTRLMQMASWLLLQRAVKEGEISAESAEKERADVSFSAPDDVRGGPGWAELPIRFKDYVLRGDEVARRVANVEKAAASSVADLGDAPNSIGAQLNKLQAAFGPASD